RRGRSRLGLVWFLMAVAGFVTLGALARMGLLTGTQWGTIGAVFGLHSLIKFWAAWEASRRFAEDRRSGALELLLTSPIGEDYILKGWMIGLKRRFLGPLALLLAGDVMLLFFGFAS